MANTYLAVDAGLELIPALNKIDLPGRRARAGGGRDRRAAGRGPRLVIRMSAKTGEGVTELLEAIVQRVPPPDGDADAPPRALIFDSEFDQYRGVVAYVRVVDGELRKGDDDRGHADRHRGRHRRASASSRPDMTPVDSLQAGEVGYLITGIKDVSLLRVGDTLTTQRAPGRRAAARLPRGQADGVLRPLPGRHRPLRRPARRAGEARPQRRRALLRAGDQPGPRLRLPLRLPRPAPHGHRARAARAGVRPGAAGHDAERGVRGEPHRRQRGARALARRHARPGHGSRRSASPTSGPRSSAHASTWAR